jgi:16S rRNA (cytosine1402-N4)-methyltransferase
MIPAPAPSAHDSHNPVMVAEALQGLALRPASRCVDATFGRGGHARAILAALGQRGRLLALDRDPAAVAAAQSLRDDRLIVVHASFGDLARAAASAGWQDVDGVLFDLGVSSPQLDAPSRGFSFRADGPLDMRMDPSRGATAAEWLAGCNEEELRKVIATYGEERFARTIAKQIVAARRDRPITTTRQLAQIVAAAVRTREPGQDPATRTFQAVRIHVNQELAQLSLALPQAIELLRPGGRLAVISFHSLEDRIVKRFLQAEANPTAGLPRLPLRERDLPQPRLRILGRAQRPSSAETAANPRARSATLRIAERLPGSPPGGSNR